MTNLNILHKQDITIELYNDIPRNILSNFLKDVSPLYPNFDTWLNFTFFRNLGSGERKILIAHDGNDVMGTALLKMNQTESKICTFYVDPIYRGQNIGHDMMESAISELNSDASIITVSEERNDELSPLLKSKGFKLTESLDGLYRPNSKEHIYSL